MNTNRKKERKKEKTPSSEGDEKVVNWDQRAHALVRWLKDQPMRKATIMKYASSHHLGTTLARAIINRAKELYDGERGSDTLIQSLGSLQLIVLSPEEKEQRESERETERENETGKLLNDLERLVDKQTKGGKTKDEL